MANIHEIQEEKFYSLLRSPLSRGQGLDNYIFRIASFGLSANLSDSEVI